MLFIWLTSGEILSFNNEEFFIFIFVNMYIHSYSPIGIWYKFTITFEGECDVEKEKNRILICVEIINFKMFS